MKNRLRAASMAIFAVLCGAPLLSTVQPPPPPPATLGPNILISYPLGNLPSLDPLVDPNTFFLIGPSQTKDLPLQIRGVNFRGPVFMSATCCSSGGPGSSSGVSLTVIPAAPADVVFRTPPPPPAPNEVRFGSNQTGLATLRVSTPSNVAPCPRTGPPCNEGTFLADLEAHDKPEFFSSTVRMKAYVVLSIMATPSEGGGAGCPAKYQSTPEILPTSQAVTSVFATKAAAPSKTVFRIGVGTIRSPRPNGWILTIAKGTTTGVFPPLTQDESLVDLKNETGSTKSLYAVDSSNCTGQWAAGNLIVISNQVGTFRISRATTSTIVLSTPTVDAVAVFSEPSFWTLFGGRRVTISWAKD